MFFSAEDLQNVHLYAFLVSLWVSIVLPDLADVIERHVLDPSRILKMSSRFEANFEDELVGLLGVFLCIYSNIQIEFI